VKVLLHVSSYICDTLEPNDAVFLGAFAKFLKVTISFVTCVCLSVHLSVWSNSHPTGWYSAILHLIIFLKSVQKIPVSLKSHKNNGYITWRSMYFYDTIMRWILRTERETFRTIVVGKIRAYILRSINFFPPKIMQFVR